jgi:hypothetical protein
LKNLVVEDFGIRRNNILAGLFLDFQSPQRSDNIQPD